MWRVLRSHFHMHTTKCYLIRGTTSKLTFVGYEKNENLHAAGRGRRVGIFCLQASVALSALR